MSPEECIDKLEQLILDENELVTYKLLSKELKIHVNEAKKYLYDFMTVQKSKEENNLYVYYFLSGLVVKDGEQVRKILVVSEDNLEKVKKEFTEIISCHIYSLNKGGPLDASSLYNSQSWCKKWAEEHREYSAIKHPNVVIQVPVIKKFEPKTSDTKPVVSKTLPVKPIKNEGATSFFKSNNKSSGNNSVDANKEKSTVDVAKPIENSNDQAKTTDTSKSESKDQKKSSLSSMWQKLEDKSKSNKNEGKSEAKGKNKNAAKTVGKNNIMSMFSKQAEKNASNPVKKTSNNNSEHVSPVSELENRSPKKEVKQILPKVEAGVKEKINQVKAKKKTSQKQTKRTSKQLSDESDEDLKPKKKKHRRICTMDDSDSESENEEAQDQAQRDLLNTEECAVISSPMSDDSEEPIPPTPPVVNNKGKKKIWKTIQKTFEDEDGFLVSKQEKVLVSASDSEEDPIPSKNSAAKTENKQNTFLYRKQASLTSFFKQR